MAPQPLVTVPGVALFRDGIRYQIRTSGFLSRFFATVISQEGFAPIEHISAVEVAEGRDLGALLFAVILMPVLIGFLLFLLWIFYPNTILRVQSEGNVFVTVIIGKRHRPQALEFIETYRKLKYSLASKVAQPLAA